MNDVREKLQRQIMQELTGYGAVSDDVLLRSIDDIICREGRLQHFSLNQRLQYRKDIFNAIRGLDVIEELLEDESVTEIMVNGYRDIFVEQNGKIRRYEKLLMKQKE